MTLTLAGWMAAVFSAEAVVILIGLLFERMLAKMRNFSKETMAKMQNFQEEKQ